MNQIQTIKSELENLIKEWHLGRSAEAKYRYEAYKELLEYINSLQEEPVSKDLEEACDEYYDETWDEHGGKAMVVDGCHDIWFPSQATDDFYKAGALWQKEQIIKNAISMDVYYETEWDDIHKFLRKNLDGEKVKLLIIKEE